MTPSDAANPAPPALLREWANGFADGRMGLGDRRTVACYANVFLYCSNFQRAAGCSFVSNWIR